MKSIFFWWKLNIEFAELKLAYINWYDSCSSRQSVPQFETQANGERLSPRTEIAIMHGTWLKIGGIKAFCAGTAPMTSSLHRASDSKDSPPRPAAQTSVHDFP